jgi:hypothetical protein
MAGRRTWQLITWEGLRQWHMNFAWAKLGLNFYEVREGETSLRLVALALMLG